MVNSFEPLISEIPAIVIKTKKGAQSIDLGHLRSINIFWESQTNPRIPISRSFGNTPLIGPIDSRANSPAATRINTRTMPRKKNRFMMLS